MSTAVIPTAALVLTAVPDKGENDVTVNPQITTKQLVQIIIGAAQKYPCK